MGDDFKICPFCKEKNNPSFQRCWKCKSDLTTGERSAADTSLKGATGGVEPKTFSENAKLITFFTVFFLLVTLTFGYHFLIVKPRAKNKPPPAQQAEARVKQEQPIEKEKSWQDQVKEIEALKLQNARDALEIQKKELEARQVQIRKEENNRAQKEFELNACLQNAEKNHKDRWLDICRQRGLLGFSDSVCSLPSHLADRLNRDLRSEKRTCAEIYK